MPPRGRRAPTWAFSLLVGALLAPVSGEISGPFWDGSARSLIPVWLIVAAIASAAIGGMLWLTGRLSLKRLSWHLLLAALGFGLFYAVLFAIIVGNPGCPVEETARRGSGLLMSC